MICSILICGSRAPLVSGALSTFAALLALSAHNVSGTPLERVKLCQTDTSISKSAHEVNHLFSLLTLIEVLQKVKPSLALNKVDIRTDSFSIELDDVRIQGCLARNSFDVTELAVVGKGKSFVHCVSKVVWLSNLRDSHKTKQVLGQLALASVLKEASNESRKRQVQAQVPESFFDTGSLRYHLLLIDKVATFHLSDIELEENGLHQAPLL